MEILFKDDIYYYHIYNSPRGRYLSRGLLEFDAPHIDFSDTIHLDDVNPLYYYRDTDDNQLLPVYYEYNKRFITKIAGYSYDWIGKRSNMVKDYTQSNLKLLDDGDIV